MAARSYWFRNFVTDPAARNARRVAMVLSALAVVATVSYVIVVHRTPIALGTAAIVLPARIEARDDRRWLELGVMDLVANELRRAGVETASSESVLALVGRDPEDADALMARIDAGAAATLRVLPSVTIEEHGYGWTVKLQAVGAGVDSRYMSGGDDVLRATRGATHMLLRQIGHPLPGWSEPPPTEIDELMYRTRAKTLAELPE